MRVLRSLCRGPAVGTDFSAGMLAQARRAHPQARRVRADVRALPFAGTFDLAVSFGAFGHFLPAERPVLFTSVHRALRPGGVFAFPAGFTVTTVPLTALGQRGDGSPRYRLVLARRAGTPADCCEPAA